MLSVIRMRLLPGLQAAGRGHAACDSGKVDEAFAGYLMSAQIGCADGMYNLAIFYKNGIACGRHILKYWEWVKKARAQPPSLSPGVEKLGVAAAENSIDVSYRDISRWCGH